jgi:N-hydroxyarylamine O-acetyltransferase
MLLRLDIEEEAWIADVGFGGSGPLAPLRLVAGLEQPQYLWAYRLVEDGGAWVLQARRASEWEDFYVFSLEPQHDVDYEVASHYVSTHPDSPFTRSLAAQRATPEARYLLRSRELTIERHDGIETRTVADAELLGVLDALFGLPLPAGTVIPDQPWVWGS